MFLCEAAPFIIMVNAQLKSGGVRGIRPRCGRPPSAPKAPWGRQPPLKQLKSGGVRGGGSPL